MLVKKRQAQHEAIKRMLELNESSKKENKDMIPMVLKKLFETLVKSMERLSQVQMANNEKGIRLDETTQNGSFTPHIYNHLTSILFVRIISDIYF